MCPRACVYSPAAHYRQHTDTANRQRAQASAPAASVDVADRCIWVSTARRRSESHTHVPRCASCRPVCRDVVAVASTMKMAQDGAAVILLPFQGDAIGATSPSPSPKSDDITAGETETAPSGGGAAVLDEYAQESVAGAAIDARSSSDDFPEEVTSPEAPEESDMKTSEVAGNERERDRDEEHSDADAGGAEDDEPVKGEKSILEDALRKPIEFSESLNKMHVMEDVREGCDEAQQPSSPGHADQRSETLQQPTDDTKEDDKFTKIVIEVPNKDDGQTEDEEAEGENKRKLDNASEESTPSKKARNEMHQEFTIRNKILTEFTEALDMNSFDTIQKKTEQIIGEIQTLNELAKEKEREWNSILHVKKLKEELLMRIQRQKQVYLLSNGLEISESEPAQYNNNGERKQRQKHELARSKSMIVRPVNNLSMLDANGHDAKYKQRPVRDVQSIIADYRQRHPESVPRRGRRIRSTINGQSVEVTSSKLSPGGIINFSSRALGSGSLVRQNFSPANQDSNSDIGMILSAMEANQQDGSTPSSTDSQDTTSFKEILVQFAKLSQSDKQELLQNTIKPPPPPYPEVTVHPVSTTTPPTNSLLHGILTKAQNKNDKSAFSPTLARLLTAPERSAAQQNGPHANVKASNVSISDILSTNKARNEITITPVGSEYESSPKRKSNTDEEEAEDSVDRLVIDEGGELVDRTDNSSDNGDEVPQCQGCNQKAAQFVCAGCGNQWYCSRECQVSAWDEHSEICSG